MTSYREILEESLKKVGTEPPLLPCPFCHAKAVYYTTTINYEPVYSVRCDDCCCNFECEVENKEDAAMYWNARPQG